MRTNGEGTRLTYEPEAASEALATINWYDSTWELRCGLEVTEDVPTHMWSTALASASLATCEEDER